jgi:phosphatidylglycerophosphate synthase
MESIKELRKICWDIEKKPSEYKRDPANWYHILLRRISIYFTWIFLHAGVKATQVTTLWGILGIAACVLLGSGSYQSSVIGALLFQLAYLFDHVDGEIARYKRTFSPKGVLLDTIIEQILFPLLFISMTLHVYRGIDHYIYVICGVSSAFFSSLIFNMQFALLYVDQERKAAAVQKMTDSEEQERGKSPDRTPLDNEMRNRDGSMMKRILSFPNAFFDETGIFLSVLLFSILNLLPILLIIYGACLPLVFIRKAYLRFKKL